MSKSLRIILQGLIAVTAVYVPCLTINAAGTAKFDGGGEIEQAVEKTGAEIIDQVDAVPGAAGSGWLSPWMPHYNSRSLRVIRVDESEPLNDGGKYLSFEFTAGGFKIPQRHSYVIRNYDEAQKLPTKFSFDLRLNDTSVFEKSSAFFIVGYSKKFSAIPPDDISGPIFPQTEGLIWALKVGSGGTWLAFSGPNGDDFVDTGFPAKQGDTFRIRIILNNPVDHWTAEIENTTAKTKFKSASLQVGTSSDVKRGFFVIGGGDIEGPSKGEALRFSFDSLSIE